MKFLVRNVSQYHGKKCIVHSVSLDVSSGSILALLGPNGAGKTTLLRTLIGLNRLEKKNSKIDENSILLDGHEISSWSVAARVQAGLVYVPQQSSLFLSLSVRDNLTMIYEYSEYWRNQDRITSRERFESEASTLIKKTHLEPVIDIAAGALSGGQKRKLEINRFLLLHPKVLMFDEPFAGVDPKSIYELKELFSELARNGMTLIISDHHVDQLLSIAHTAMVMVGGKVVARGSIQEIIENEYTRTMYLGQEFYSEMTERHSKK